MKVRDKVRFSPDRIPGPVTTRRALRFGDKGKMLVQYVNENPGCTAAEAAQAMPYGTNRIISVAMHNLVKKGRLQAKKQDYRIRYYPSHVHASAVLSNQSYTPTQLKELAKEFLWEHNAYEGASIKAFIESLGGK